MKAVLCKEFGPPESLVVEEVPDPTAGPGQVVVDVYACGLNFPDVLMLGDKYQFKPASPSTAHWMRGSDATNGNPMAVPIDTPQ